jgi:hypothetical protein
MGKTKEHEKSNLVLGGLLGAYWKMGFILTRLKPAASPAYHGSGVDNRTTLK